MALCVSVCVCVCVSVCISVGVFCHCVGRLHVGCCQVVRLHAACMLVLRIYVYVERIQPRSNPSSSVACWISSLFLPPLALPSL